MSHIFSRISIKFSQPVHFFKKMKVLIAIVSSNINEVIRAVLNLFFYERISQPQKSTKRLQAKKNKAMLLKNI